MAQGRPKKKDKFSKSIPIRFSDEQYQLICKYASVEHLEVSTFIRQLIMEMLVSYEDMKENLEGIKLIHGVCGKIIDRIKKVNKRGGEVK